jgi:nucleotide-binding universal stress UspA family protein
MTSEQAEMARPEITPSTRIVAGIDGSDASLEALDWAARQADMTHSSLEIVMTWDWPPDYGWAMTFPSGYDPSETVEKLLQQARSAVHERYPDLDTSAKVVQGHPAPVLVDASKGAGLLVVGSRGHGEFLGMLIGSVSEHCATHAYCPVLIHRSVT